MLVEEERVPEMTASAAGSSSGCPNCRCSSQPCVEAAAAAASVTPYLIRSPNKSHDYLLKFLLVGDSDVGKTEILGGLEDGAAAHESPYSNSSSLGIYYKTTTILMDGKRVKLQLWDASGQGRFCTIIRSYSRGAQGVLLVYDITNRWSFDGIDRWLKEIEEHAPGVPKVLVGNRLDQAYRRQVSEIDAEAYARRSDMAFFEVSPLCDFNVKESLTELSRLALRRNGMERIWRSGKVVSLQEACCRTVVSCTTMYGIEQLPLPNSLKHTLKSYANQRQGSQLRRIQSSHAYDNNSKKHHRRLNSNSEKHHHHRLPLNPSESPRSSRKHCAIS